MTAVEDIDPDLLPDDLAPEPKGAAVPVKRSAKQARALARAQADAAAKKALADDAKRLAQIVNLSIAGYSFLDIGAAIGATPEEVERLLVADVSRYVRTQPALRTYVRNWVSERYMKMIEADWIAASDPAAPDKLEHQDRVMRMLNNMAKLHGAEAPAQSEVKVEAAPAVVDALVAKIAASQGLDYSTDIFDVPEADIHEAVEVSRNSTEAAGSAVEVYQEGETDGF